MPKLTLIENLDNFKPYSLKLDILTQKEVNDFLYACSAVPDKRSTIIDMLFRAVEQQNELAKKA